MTTKTVSLQPEPEVAPVQKREIFGWAMYDFANSSYTTVVISAVYSAFFASVIVPEDSPMRDTYWSIAMVTSAIIAIVLSPLVGAICDYSGNKKKYLFYATICCAISTSLLMFVEPGSVWQAIFFVTISNSAYMIGEAFCGSFLTDLSTKQNIGLISGLGWGLGYFGGLLSLVIVQFIITSPETDFIAYVTENQRAMLSIGLFYLITSIPTFWLVRERSRPRPGYENASILRLFSQGVLEMLNSAQLVRDNKTMFKFFAAFTVYMAGLQVVVKFIGIYAREELAMTMSDFIPLFLILQLSAAAGAVFFGYVERFLGAKNTVLASILWWILGILGIYYLAPLAEFFGITQIQAFFVISSIAGSGMGSVQSASRTVVGILSPKDRTAQMFGFWGMFSRVAIILGMVFGPLADALNSRHQALLLVLGFFAVGGIMLLFVDIGKKSMNAQKSI